MINDRAIKLIQVIEKNPGIKFREIMRVTGLKNGVLSHHLSKIEKSGSVQVKQNIGTKKYFPLTISDEQAKIIIALRRDTQRRILHTLMLHTDGLGFTEIVKNVSKSPSTVSLYLSQLFADKIIYMFLHERKRRYKIVNRELVDELIENYHPGMLDKPISGLIDIVNSL